MKITVTEQDLDTAIKETKINPSISHSCVLTIAAKRYIPEIQWSAFSVLGEDDHINTHRFKNWRLVYQIQDEFDFKKYNKVRARLPVTLVVVPRTQKDRNTA